MGPYLTGIALGLAVACALVALILARRWLFFIWTVIRPATWPAALGLLLFAVLGLVDQGQALVQRALEGPQTWFLVTATLIAAVLTGYAAASLLFVRYGPIAAGLHTARDELRLPPERYDAWCARLRRAFPLVVSVLPVLALVPGTLIGWFPAHRDLATMVPLVGVLALAAIGLLAADTPLLRDRPPPRRRWLWPLRYPDLSDQGIEDAFAIATVPAHGLMRRMHARLLVGMLPGTRWAFTAAFVLGVVTFLAATNLRTDWTAMVGTAAIVVAAAASMAVTGALAAHWINHRFSVTVPYLLALLLLAAGLFARWGLSDNHAVREVAAGDRAAELERAQRRPTLEEHLAEWLAAHRAGDAGRTQPYPLLVAAAEGGGIRAALWTALALGELQRRIPSLPCDLFAIAGVSGGAVGAATYAAMLADEPPDCSTDPAATVLMQARAKAYKAAASAAFGQDLLAPAAAGMLFPDLLQRFLPWPWLPDRQSYLEDGWEKAWAGAATNMAGLDRPFLSLFPEEQRGRLPALFLVGSEVEGGRRWIASDVRIDRNTFADAADTLAGTEIEDTDDLRGMTLKAFPVSAAAGMSARFPYVSPSGTLHFAAGTLGKRGPVQARTFHILDGGVVEASGAATAGEILLALRSHCTVESQTGVLACRLLPAGPATGLSRDGVTRCDGRDDCIRVRPAVIQFTNDAWEPAAVAAAESPLKDALSPHYPELLGPVEALLASREGRGRAAHDRLQGDSLLTADQGCFGLDIVLNGDNAAATDPRIPLGWTLLPSHVAAMLQKIDDIASRPALPPEQRSFDFASWRSKVYGPSRADPCAASNSTPASAG